MDARDSLDRAYRHALDKQAENAGDLLGRYIGAFQLFGAFAVGFIALAAAEALIPFSIFSKGILMSNFSSTLIMNSTISKPMRSTPKATFHLRIP